MTAPPSTGPVVVLSSTLTSTPDVIAAWEREAEERGFRRGYREGFKIGLKEGLKIGLREGLIANYEIRFGTIPQDLAALIHKTPDEPTLRGWYKVLRTSSAEEIAAALRSAR